MRRTQAPTLPLVSQFYTFSEHQPKDIEDKVCMYHSWSLCTEGRMWRQEYILFLEYFKLIVNCSCVQKKKETRNKKRYLTWLTQNLVEQSSGNNLLNSRILNGVSCINWELKFSMKSTMSSLNTYFKLYRNNKLHNKSLKRTSFSAWFDGSRV